jgi:putative monooxygenase
MLVETKTLKLFKDGEEIWLGLDSPGFRRKVFRLVNASLTGSEHIVAGLTIFDPGEASAYHNHPGSEEADVVLKGECRAEWGTADEVRQTGEMGSPDFMTIGKGVFHKHVNTGNEPLWFVWFYTPPGELSTE